MRNDFLILASLLLSLLSSGCRHDPNPCSLPLKTIEDIHELDSLMSSPAVLEHYERYIDRNDEPSFLDAKKETYRFIWNSSFDGTLIIRIEDLYEERKMIRKRVNHRDSILHTDEFNISQSILDNILDSLSTCNFWTYTPSIERQILDGASWTLEGYKPIRDECTLKNHHIVYRASPRDSTFISMCRLFYNLEKIDSLEFY